jgi:hypothetical protein
MIYYIVPDAHAQRARARLESRAALNSLQVRISTYSQLVGHQVFPKMALILTGLEFVPAAAREAACRLWQALAASRVPIAFLNHPLLAMQRYELLRELRERGINAFDAYRLTEARRPRLYPVFLRDEALPLAKGTRLLRTPAELESLLGRLVREGRNRDARLIVEFCGERDSRERYRRFGAYCINGAIVPCRPTFDTDWVVATGAATQDPDQQALEAAHLSENPHAETLRHIFRIARIDFGRIDYGILDDRIQVYGIHTDPFGEEGGDDADLDRLVAGMVRLEQVVEALYQRVLSLRQ